LKLSEQLKQLQELLLQKETTSDSTVTMKAPDDGAGGVKSLLQMPNTRTKTKSDGIKQDSLGASQAFTIMAPQSDKTDPMPENSTQHEIPLQVMPKAMCIQNIVIVCVHESLVS